MDVLEAPQLMDTCVRNGNYDDALDLRAFVAKLLLIHPNLQVRQGRKRCMQAMKSCKVQAQEETR